MLIIILGKNYLFCNSILFYIFIISCSLSVIMKRDYYGLDNITQTNSEVNNQNTVKKVDDQVDVDFFELERSEIFQTDLTNSQNPQNPQNCFAASSTLEAKLDHVVDKLNKLTTIHDITIGDLRNVITTVNDLFMEFTKWRIALFELHNKTEGFQYQSKMVLLHMEILSKQLKEVQSMFYANSASEFK